MVGIYYQLAFEMFGVTVKNNGIIDILNEMVKLQNLPVLKKENLLLQI